MEQYEEQYEEQYLPESENYSTIDIETFKKIFIIFISIISFALIYTYTTNYQDWGGLESETDLNFINMLYFTTKIQLIEIETEIQPITHKAKLLVLLNHFILMYQLYALFSIF